MSDKIVNLFIWLLMSMMFGYFAYSQGWILSGFKNLSPLEAKQLIEEDKSLILIDVRSAKAFEKDTIANAINLPLEKLQQSLENIQSFKNRNLLLYSERGEQSIIASRLLSKQGFTVFNLKGGIVFWIRGGEKIIKK